MTDRSLTLSAPAKINFYLGVHTERDDRGYHLSLIHISEPTRRS